MTFNLEITKQAFTEGSFYESTEIYEFTPESDSKSFLYDILVNSFLGTASLRFCNLPLPDSVEKALSFLACSYERINKVEPSNLKNLWGLKGESLLGLAITNEKSLLIVLDEHDSEHFSLGMNLLKDYLNEKF